MRLACWFWRLAEKILPSIRLLKFLRSIKDRLGAAAVKGKALDLCQELFIADGLRSDEEEDVFQNLKKRLE